MIIVVSNFKNDIQYIYVHVKFHAFGGPKENISAFLVGWKLHSLQKSASSSYDLDPCMVYYTCDINFQ